MREYSKVSPKLWRSPRFRALQDSDARLFYVYCLSSEHQTSCGAFRLPDAYAASDLNWKIERLVAAREQLIAADLLAFDAGTEEYFVPRWFRHNPPTNGRHLQGVKRIVSEIDSDRLRETAESELAEQQSNRNPIDDVLTGSSRLAATGYLNGSGRTANGFRG